METEWSELQWGYKVLGQQVHEKGLSPSWSHKQIINGKSKTREWSQDDKIEYASSWNKYEYW